ncbi:DUF3737 family protein [Lactobacillus sp. ESL0791]|uniref:DUF3737 family protein n=1 Tax=Lactobacillus sp. ESL0791 TaxID=2983234 RepID=UPI0023F8D354|nr:DUF3737 family protein [Lactobacillus sp. ESL0791]MDF7639410.1 DUF3737 family protein [Lactobacillus sp. ESL0791]
MKIYQEKHYSGERPMFATADAKFINTTFGIGESPLKESKNLILDGVIFQYKYPLWYTDNVSVKNTILEKMARSGIWYAKNLRMQDCTLQAPKLFRRCQKITLNNVDFADAQETFWNCHEVKLTNVQATGDYFGMNSSKLKADHLKIVGNYAFDGASDVEIHDSVLLSKDAFWNCQNVTIYDSVINGEYLGWNTKNLTLINCTISGYQDLCYIDHLVLHNCRLLQTDLSFEYCSDIDAEVTTTISSVKNPLSGQIKAPKINLLILDKTKVDPTATEIIAKIGERK